MLLCAQHIYFSYVFLQSFSKTVRSPLYLLSFHSFVWFGSTIMCLPACLSYNLLKRNKHGEKLHILFLIFFYPMPSTIGFHKIEIINIYFMQNVALQFRILPALYFPFLFMTITSATTIISSRRTAKIVFHLRESQKKKRPGLLMSNCFRKTFFFSYKCWSIFYQRNFFLSVFYNISFYIFVSWSGLLKYHWVICFYRGMYVILKPSAVGAW